MMERTQYRDPSLYKTPEMIEKISQATTQSYFFKKKKKRGRINVRGPETLRKPQAQAVPQNNNVKGGWAWMAEAAAERGWGAVTLAFAGERWWRFSAKSVCPSMHLTPLQARSCTRSVCLQAEGMCWARCRAVALWLVTLGRSGGRFTQKSTCKGSSLAAQLSSVHL